jgi:hypothetical protein
MLSRYGIAESMTRKTMVGLVGVVGTKRKSQRDDDASAGLTVMQNRKSGTGVEVRHARTTDVSSIATAELNVVRAKLYMMEQLKDTIDTTLIGKVTADDKAPLTVATVVEGVLESLVDRKIITTYAGTSAQLSTSNPTQVSVRFVYKPAFTLNYVSIQFSIDLSTGTVDFTNSTTTLGA